MGTSLLSSLHGHISQGGWGGDKADSFGWVVGAIYYPFVYFFTVFRSVFNSLVRSPTSTQYKYSYTLCMHSPCLQCDILMNCFCNLFLLPNYSVLY